MIFWNYLWKYDHNSKMFVEYDFFSIGSKGNPFHIAKLCIPNLCKKMWEKLCFYSLFLANGQFGIFCYTSQVPPRFDTQVTKVIFFDIVKKWKPFPHCKHILFQKESKFVDPVGQSIKNNIFIHIFVHGY